MRSARHAAGARGGQRRLDAVASGEVGEIATLRMPFDLAAGPVTPESSYSRCCGLDEVGRGALAGPLVAAAVILPEGITTSLGPLRRFLRDSKTVPAARRQELAEWLRAHALAIEIVVVPAAEINRRGIGWANREAFQMLIERLVADDYVVDGRLLPRAPAGRAARVRCLVDADALVPAVSAASIVAKVHRDTLMHALHEEYPVYGWLANVGYGTAAHVAALRTHGTTAEHRIQFVNTALGLGATRRSRRRGAQPQLLDEALDLD